MLKKLQINNFRNIENSFFELNKGINLFYGQNGQGKTNLIEAIYYLFHNKSFKTNKINDVIEFDNHQFLLQALVNDDKVRINKTLKKNSISINQKSINKSIDLVNILPIQLISPDKGFIVGSTPKNKRYYLNWGIFHLEQNVEVLLKNYQKTIKNINFILSSKDKNKNLTDFFYLFSQQTVIINQYREKYLSLLKTFLNDKCFLDFKKKYLFINSFNFELFSGFPSEVDALNEKDVFNFLLKNKNKIIIKNTLNYGSHRADIVFSSNSKIDKFLSRGEQKILSFVFWILQVLSLVQKNKPPLLLIDDMHSELDDEKYQLVLDLLQYLDIQTIITSIQPPLKKDNKNKIQLFNIKQGQITPLYKLNN